MPKSDRTRTGNGVLPELPKLPEIEAQVCQVVSDSPRDIVGKTERQFVRMLANATPGAIHSAAKTLNHAMGACGQATAAQKDAPARDNTGGAGQATAAARKLFIPMKQENPLKRAGEDISACYKMIEEAWKKAETQLALAHVPIEVRVQVREADNDPSSPYYCGAQYLSYSRYKSEWRVCVVDSDFDSRTGDDVDTCRSISECPVELRLEMFDHFEKLHAAVLATTKDYVPKVKDRVTKFLASLETLDR